MGSQREGVSQAEALAAFAGAYGSLTTFVRSLDDEGFAAASRCSGWTVRDVLFHELLDAQRALVALATPSNAEPDVDFVEYWRPFRPGMPGAAEHAAFVRAAAAAYSAPQHLAEQWVETAGAAVRAANQVDARLRVSTQGHTLALSDFLVTLTVEAAIHHLDMSIAVPGTGPSHEALKLVRRTLDGLLGASPPLPWTPETYALKGTGRVQLDDDDRNVLDRLAERFPLLG